MRIAFNMVSLHTGGGNRIAKNLLLSLENHPEHDYLIFIPEKSGFEFILERSKIPYTVYFKKHRKTSFWGRLWFDNVTIPRKVTQFRADILISLTNISTFIPPIPHIVLFHHPHYVYPESAYYNMIGPGERIRKELEKICFRLTLKGSSITVVQTPVSGDRLLKYYRRFITRDKIRVIPHSAIPITPEPAMKFDYPYDPDILYLFSPTRYYPHKNLELLGKIAEALHKQDISGVKFLITLEPSHDGRSKRFLKEISSPLINTYFDNLGFVETECLEDIYKHIDIVIVHSILESQSFSYLEALYFNKPILTTDMDFAHIVCGDGACYFSPDNPEEWAEFIGQVKKDKTHLEEMASASARRAESYLVSSDEVCQTYLDLTEEVISSR
ncbi:MAG TPA: glycosyltransferase family 1 protein [Candidatus Marinimicrobia bacterium]|nr:glycosyltransferase family 1 protein [Candidatus Neomarinimicrobiota bacterium]